MHQQPLAHVLITLLGSLAQIPLTAAAAMPLIIALTLARGRRENGRSCLQLAHQAAKINLLLAAGSFLLLLLQFWLLLAQFAPHQAPFFRQNILGTIFMPWTLTLLIWLTGSAVIFTLPGSMKKKLARLGPQPERTQYTRATRSSFCLCLLCTGLLFISFITAEWPFAGLPPGMDIWRVARALLKNAVHVYFTGFAMAGATLLATWPIIRQALQNTGADVQDQSFACRWCGIWAALGLIPYCVQNWGLALGQLLHSGHGTLPGWRIAGLTLATLFIVCCCLFLKQGWQTGRKLIVWAWGCLLLWKGLPLAQWVFSNCF